jgi:hypothetical protein
MKGSESSRNLQRRASRTSQYVAPNDLVLFFELQRLRCRRLAARALSHVTEARRRQWQDGGAYEVEVRGSCGSDVHVTEGRMSEWGML